MKKRDGGARGAGAVAAWALAALLLLAALDRPFPTIQETGAYASCP